MSPLAISTYLILVCNLLLMPSKFMLFFFQLVIQRVWSHFLRFLEVKDIDQAQHFDLHFKDIYFRDLPLKESQVLRSIKKICGSEVLAVDTCKVVVVVCSLAFWLVNFLPDKHVKYFCMHQKDAEQNILTFKCQRKNLKFQILICQTKSLKVSPSKWKLLMSTILWHVCVNTKVSLIISLQYYYWF